MVVRKLVKMVLIYIPYGRQKLAGIAKRPPAGCIVTQQFTAWAVILVSLAPRPL